MKRAPTHPTEVTDAIVLGDGTPADTSEQDEILAAGIDLGRLEAVDFIATVAESAAAVIYENIKKSKAWRHLKNPQSCDGRNFESIDEFCRVKLGKSYRRLQELSSNRDALGQEAFEQSERLGLRQVDYNAIKALPQPKQELIREALTEAASKEDIQRALRELAAADQREIEALAQQVETANSRAANADVDRARAEAEAEGLRKQLRRQQRDDEDALIPAAMADLRQEIGAQVKKAELAIQSMERLARDLAEMQGGAASDYVSPTAQLALAGMISLRVQLDSRMAQFKEQFDCEGITGTGPDKLAALLPFEVAKLASHWAALTDAHKHEGLLRAHERESARPRGRGRPKAAPADPV